MSCLPSHRAVMEYRSELSPSGLCCASGKRKVRERVSFPLSGTSKINPVTGKRLSILILENDLQCPESSLSYQPDFNP